MYRGREVGQSPPGRDAPVGVPTGLLSRVFAEGDSRGGSGGTGEIWVRGAAVTSGYLNDPKATAEAFGGGLFRSGL